MTSCQSPNFVIKKNPSHGARHGPTEWQRIYYKAHHMRRKAVKKKYNTILKRSLKDSLCQDSSTKIGWDENIIIALRRDRTRGATRGEGSRNENSWRLVSDAEGANGPLDQRDDHKEAKETCNRLHKESAATEQYFHNNKSDKGPTSNSKGTKRIRMVATVRQLVGKHGIGNLHHGVNSVFSRSGWEIFACGKCNFPGIDGGVNSTPSAHTFFLMRTVSWRLLSR